MTTPGASKATAQGRPQRRLITVGPLAGSPHSVTIWQSIREFFWDGPVELDFILYSNYARANAALLAGQVDVVWQGPLTHVRALRQTGGRCKGLAMRDTDVAFQSFVVARRGSGIASAQGLRGKRLALGTEMDAQASIMPLHYLAEAGVAASDLTLVRPPAKGGRLVAAEPAAIAALLAGEVDAAVISTKTWEGLRRPGQPGGDLEVVFETPGYSHCIMTALDTLDDDLATAMELEWMHRWVPAEGADCTVLMAEVERLAARGALTDG